MVLAGALFALFMTGVWLYCLTDVVLTPAADCRGLSKRAWVALVVVTLVIGALAWLAVRRPARDAARAVPPMPGAGLDSADDVTEAWTAADDAAARHPAGRARVTGPLVPPKGPDDDQEFLLALERAIRGNPPVT